MSSSAGENCHRCGGTSTGNLTPTLSGELLCSDCHSKFAEEWLSNRSPPRSPPSPIPVTSPPTEPRYQISFTRTGRISLRHLGNVLDQEVPPSRNLSTTEHTHVFEVDADLMDTLWGVRPAARSAVEALVDVEVDAQISQSNCNACTLGFDYGMEVKRMPCNHLYHKDCILPWLNTHNTCQTCSYELPIENSDDSSGSENRPAGVSGSDIPPAVSDDENIGGSGSGSGFGA